MGNEEFVGQMYSLCVKGVCGATCPGLHCIHVCVLLTPVSAKPFLPAFIQPYLIDLPLSATGCLQEWKAWSEAMVLVGISIDWEQVGG